MVQNYRKHYHQEFKVKRKHNIKKHGNKIQSYQIKMNHVCYRKQYKLKKLKSNTIH